MKWNHHTRHSISKTSIFFFFLRRFFLKEKIKGSCHDNLSLCFLVIIERGEKITEKCMGFFLIVIYFAYIDLFDTATHNIWNSWYFKVEHECFWIGQTIYFPFADQVLLFKAFWAGACYGFLKVLFNTSSDLVCMAFFVIFEEFQFKWYAPF